MTRGLLAALVAMSWAVSPQFRMERTHGGHGSLVVPPEGMEVHGRHHGLAEGRLGWRWKDAHDREFAVGHAPDLGRPSRDAALVEGGERRSVTSREAEMAKQREGARALALMMEHATETTHGQMNAKFSPMGLIKDLMGVLTSTKEVVPGDYPYMCVCNPPQMRPDGTVIAPKDQSPLCPTDTHAYDCFVKREYREKELLMLEELPHPELKPLPMGPPADEGMFGFIEKETHEIPDHGTVVHVDDKNRALYQVPEEQIKAILAENRAAFREMEDKLSMPLPTKIARAALILLGYAGKLLVVTTGLLAAVAVVRRKKGSVDNRS